MSGHDRGHTTSWWAMHPILRTLGIATGTLALGALVLLGHIWVGTTSGPSGHNTSGDIVFYAAVAMVVVVVTGLVIARQRAS